MNERTDRGECDVDGCGRPVEKSGLCAAHRKRKQRLKLTAAPKRRGRPRLAYHAPVTAPAPPLQALARSGRELADADAELSNEKFKHVEERFRAALRRYLAKWKAKKNPSPHPVAPKTPKPKTPKPKASKLTEWRRRTHSRAQIFPSSIPEIDPDDQ